MNNNNITILVADEDAQSRRVIAEALAGEGRDIMQALDGGTAIKVVEDRPVDIAIVAHRMSPHTGFEFARHVLMKKYPVSLILLVDESSTDLLTEARRHNIKHVVNKPVNTDRLLETVRRVLRERTA
ncbi:MAG: response regulator [Proteobacteria bacterium]|nr:response regulator [Pseudomonadota bacterium]